jgi:hypothetical protein
MRTLVLSARIAVVLVLVASTQSVLVVRAAFELDREAIAERLCVNRDRPELDCEGACVLSRLMAEQQEREDSRREAALEIALSITPLVSERVAVPATPAAETAAPGEGAVLAFAEGVAPGVDRPPRQG